MMKNKNDFAGFSAHRVVCLLSIPIAGDVSSGDFPRLNPGAKS